MNIIALSKRISDEMELESQPCLRAILISGLRPCVSSSGLERPSACRDVFVTRSEPKISGNEPCPYGSGEKPNSAVTYKT